ncbi:unnamed protein product [Porites lobata]|uniref:Dystrophin n=1 Tax=Porites lobata TaxID=104759 RepID=A0ABN8MWZ7_9CNID|nr:unnamed protein product [Porites lobata]
MTGILTDGWERSETTNGVPYYIDHETERTHWDHPDMISLLEEIESLNNIKYAAYRTAMKLRAIQKKTQLYMVGLHAIKSTFDGNGIKDGFVDGNLSVEELMTIITAVFENQSGVRGTNRIDVSLASELVLNWILNVYDPGRLGYVPILSFKIGLVVMCSEKVQEKYRYLFLQLCNNQGFLDSKRLKLFLQQMILIPKYIYESAAFSGSSVEPAVRNCFERVSIPEIVSIEEFIEWMIAEPQTIVWLPTLHRLAVSETVKHEAKCNVCKMYPIVGFRYRCLKCFNFDLCQGCFWLGRVNKQHKIGHPTQEYCLVSTQKEDIKDFAKVMRNKVSKKKKKAPQHPSKGRFIPIEMEEAPPSEEEDEDSIDAGTPRKGLPETRKKPEGHTARLPQNELREEDEEPTYAQPVRTRPVKNDEHRLIRHYAKSLTGQPDSTSPDVSQMARDLDSQEKQDLEDLIARLEDDNRALQGEINTIHQLQRHNESEQSIVPAVQEPVKEAFLRHQRERLEAREEVLEEHNYQLQVQLHRLRILLQQGDLPQPVSSAMKSVVQPSPPARSSRTVAEATSVAPQTNHNTPTLSVSRVPQQTTYVSGISSPHILTHSSIPQNTFLTPGPPVPAYPAQYSLTPGVSPPWRNPLIQPHSGDIRGNSPNTSATSLTGPFVPKTAAELGLLDRPVSSTYEGMELSNIVDRMTAAFPMDMYSDMQVDVHNDLFLSASLIGEAMQSMVNTVSRDIGARKGGINSVDAPRFRRDPDEPDFYGQGISGSGEWPREDLDVSSRHSNDSSTEGYEYGPL